MIVLWGLWVFYCFWILVRSLLWFECGACAMGFPDVKYTNWRSCEIANSGRAYITLRVSQVTWHSIRLWGSSFQIDKLYRELSATHRNSIAYAWCTSVRQIEPAQRYVNVARRFVVIGVVYAANFISHMGL